MEKLFIATVSLDRDERPTVLPLALITHSRLASSPCVSECESKVPSTPYLKLFDFLLKLQAQSLLIFHFALQLTVLKIFPVKGNAERVRTRHPGTGNLSTAVSGRTS